MALSGQRVNISVGLNFLFRQKTKTLFAFADLYNLEIKFVLLLFMNNLELQPKP